MDSADNSNITTNNIIKPTSNAPKDENGSLFDIKIVNLYSKWLNVGKIGPGLYNHGNTCFMNATLQCLLHIPALSQIFQHENKFIYNPSSGERTDHLVIRAYQKLVLEIFSSSCGRVISPRAMIQNIRKVGKQFRPLRQEDAHEYLRELLFCMHEEILKGYNLKCNRGKISETTLISRVFGGYLCNELECPRCKYLSKTYNPFQDISLDLINSTNSVSDAIKNFTKSEILTAGNEWKCQKCSKSVCATKRLSIDTSPPVLVLHLKRFSFINGIGKINKHIKFDSTLDVMCGSSVVEDNKGENNNRNSESGFLSKYELSGVITHHGKSIHSGHYIAFVKGSNGLWHEMNDNFVTATSLKNVLSQQAYVLFYTKVLTKKDMKEIVPITQNNQNNSSNNKNISSSPDAISNSLNFNSNSSSSRTYNNSLHPSISPDIATIKAKKMSPFGKTISHSTTESPSLNSQHSNNSIGSNSSRSSMSRLHSRGATRVHRWQGITQKFSKFRTPSKKRRATKSIKSIYSLRKFARDD